MEEDGKLPDVVIELLSPSTEAMDRGEKKRVYERAWRTEYYVLFDVETAAVETFQLVAGRYRPIVPDARGDFLIPRMGLALGVRSSRHRTEDGGWLRWIDADGAPLPTGVERAQRADRQTLDANERAEAAERRVAELEAKLRERG